MHKLTKALVLTGLVANLGVCYGMDSPPPVGKGWQRVILDTDVWGWDAPQLPGVDVGTPISASWVFDSDNAPDSVRVHDFTMKFAGVEYGSDDLLDSLFKIYVGTSGVSANFYLAAAGGLPALQMHIFDEFATSNLWIYSDTYGVVGANFDGHYEAVIPEPASYCLVFAGLLGAAVAGRRRSI